MTHFLLEKSTIKRQKKASVLTKSKTLNATGQSPLDERSCMNVKKAAYLRTLALKEGNMS